MSEFEAERDELEVLAADFAERLRSGEQPSISSYEDEHPALAKEIRELFATIASVEHLKVQRARSRGAPASLGVAKLERLGDFRIVREVGRGGMGIVYEAVQESLGRSVAIKVLPRSPLMDPEHRERFEREARLAARLHHTNIVPVFGVGEEEGFHYYVMQLIEGTGLDALLAEHKGSPPLSWRQVANLGAQAARALHHAHSHGILHRDIKPANLLLDSEGEIWITDFGVAKALESEDLTQTGNVSGTLRYVAPERFEAESADPRSDQYSLGLTLYEVLTARPAFEASNARELVHCISHTEPVPPHRLVPHIPRDLETIVLKATAREPRRRYPSAGALAEDLQRFLDGSPVAARRLGAAARLWRWCRRNPLPASLTSAVALLLVAVAVVSSIGYLGTRRANRLAGNALRAETHQRERAEFTSELALKALDRIYSQFAPASVARASELSVEDASGSPVEVPLQPAVSRETAALLEELLGFYDKLAAQGGKDPRPRREAALANRRIGAIQHLLGQDAKAEESYLRALKLLGELAEDPAPEPPSRVEIAHIRNELGIVQGAAGHWRRAQRSHHEALDLLLSAEGKTRSAPAWRYELAQTYYLLGTQGRPKLIGEPPPPESGDHRLFPGPDPTPAERDAAWLEQAIELLEELQRESPALPAYRHLLACCLRDLPPNSNVNPGLRLARTEEILEKLVAEFPQVPAYRQDLCETYGRAKGDEARILEGVAIAEKLVAQRPDVPAYAVSLVQLHLKLAAYRNHGGEPKGAQTSARRALALQEELVRRFPESDFNHLLLAVCRRDLARVLAGGEDLAEPRALLEKALEGLDDLWQRGPREPHLRRLLGACCHELAELLYRAGKAREAEEVERREQNYQEER